MAVRMHDLAIRRDATLLPNPSTELRLLEGDQLALIGESSQVAAAEMLLTT